MVSKFILITVFVIASITAVVVRADESGYSQQTVSELKSAISQALAQNFRQFNQPRIELGTIRLTGGVLPKKIQSVSFQGENSRGQAQFAVYGETGDSAEVLADYSALTTIRVANRRIQPGERLSSELFASREVNLATGMPYELRGVLLSKNEDLSKLETRQTLLEGQFLVSTAVQKVPDVRRGDMVRVRVISGDLSLSTQAQAVEPGYSNTPIKVVTAKTHHELTGVLHSDGVVEVKL